MKEESISRINYRNSYKELDFEIVDLQDFYATRSHKHLNREFRLNFWVILYITKGAGTHYIDFQRYDYAPGSMIFIQKNQVQRFVVNSKVQGYILNINEPFFYRIEGFKGDIFLEFVDKAYGSSLLTFDTSEGTTNRILLELIKKEYDKEHFNVVLIATLFQGFVLALREQVHVIEPVFLSKDYENFKVFRALLEKNYTTTRQVEDYAAMMHVSKKTVNQASRVVAGLSAKEFITHRIVLEIKRYLSQGKLMNYEIADLLGFDEAANMTSFFKRYVGMPPKDFRALVRH